MKQYHEKLFGKKHMVAATSDLSNSFLINIRTALLNAKLPTFWRISKVLHVFRDNDKAEIEQNKSFNLKNPKCPIVNHNV